MSELKPCPFCGGNPTAITSENGFTSVGCLNGHSFFGVMVQGNTEAEAADKWNARAAELYRFPENKRAADARLDEQVQKLFEEFLEVVDAHANGEPDSRVIEELWDVIQAVEGCFRKFDENDVLNGLRFVLRKSEERGDYGDA